MGTECAPRQFREQTLPERPSILKSLRCRSYPANPISIPPSCSTSVALAPAGQWWAMYTMARREKELMRRLRALEIPFYAPLVHKRTRSPGGRVRESYVPLFASYVFVRGTQPQRAASADDQLRVALPRSADAANWCIDLRQIRRLIELDAPLTVEARIEPGRRVRVRSGPMAGLEGMVVKRRGKDWLVVAVEFLRQGASVLLEDFQVEPL